MSRRMILPHSLTAGVVVSLGAFGWSLAPSLAGEAAPPAGRAAASSMASESSAQAEGGLEAGGTVALQETEPGAAVRLWEEPVVLPTYEVASPDLNPRFYGGRVYQGAMASFYPYPVYDRLTDARRPRTYTAVYIENRYVRIGILPEIGGRIFSAVDKTNGYDFFYRQHVIKPALIGMLGAWISGGVEWNVPHHHRATSFLPVDHTCQSRADGSKTVWVGETEWRHRMRWIVGITLYPDRSFVEMTVKIFNRTPLAHSFLFWINPAVHANENYQVIFPPRTEFAVQHGKPEFARWPVADGVYAGVDYRGIDISWWKNHPAPVSFFAWDSTEDFFGGYDHGRQAGVLHVANHHVVPGKKFFEWGNGPQGRLWDTILTETDGPYLELMAGAYSDNQPDYSWCQPGEVKIFQHYWYPIRELCGAKAATADAAVNLEFPEVQADGRQGAKIAVNTTTEVPSATVTLAAGSRVLLRKQADIGPASPFSTEVPLPEATEKDDLKVSVADADGRELVAYFPPGNKYASSMPKPVERPRPPKDIATSEGLYLTGLRIEQLYSPLAEPEPYYEEAIRRDPGDNRANAALALLHLKHARYSEAEARLRMATERATGNYIRPKDGEAFYYLGVALRAQGKLAQARDALWRSIWSAAWQAPGYYALAELACLEGNHACALDLVERSLSSGRYSTKALNLKATVLRRLGHKSEAKDVALEVLAIDPLDFRAANELCRLGSRLPGLHPDEEAPTAPASEGPHETLHEGMTARALDALDRRIRGEPQSYLEMAVDYGNCGFYEDAITVLRRGVEACGRRGTVHPMLYYYLGHYSGKLGRDGDARECCLLAAGMPGQYCFPFRFESIEVLEEAMRRNPRDCRAPCYLGNLLYDHQPDRAIQAWEAAIQLDPSLALAYRNLGIGYAQARGDIPRAIELMERAVAINPKDARLLYELDLLYEEGNTPLEKRLAVLEKHAEVIAERDDAYTRRILVSIRLGKLDEALAHLESRRFHNWEGRGEIHSAYVDALLQRGQKRLHQGDARNALGDFLAALEYPENLEVAPPYRDRRAGEVHFWIGKARESLADAAGAKAAFELAAASKGDAFPDAQYCAGLALRRLGREEEAVKVFESLLERGTKDLEAASDLDYFAKFGDRQTERARKARAYYLRGLGYLGLMKTVEASLEFQKTLKLDVSHLGARARFVAG